MKTLKYFSATWCGPCKTFKPVMNEIAGEGYSVQFIDIDQSSSAAEQYNVRSVPTVAPATVTWPTRIAGTEASSFSISHIKLLVILSSSSSVILSIDKL